jgi:hypothetical protein
MTWTLVLSKRANKQKEKLPARIRVRLDALTMAIEVSGPTQPTMPHFGKLKGVAGEVYHCHLNKGRPTYVAVWRVKDRRVELVEVLYVGTHENAPY